MLKNGVRDAWTGPPESRHIETALAQAVAETSMMRVSRTYFDRAVRHHLCLGLATGIWPRAGVLPVAETVGGSRIGSIGARISSARTDAMLAMGVPQILLADENARSALMAVTLLSFAAPTMIKTGSASRSERIAKYNRLFEIEAESGNAAEFGAPFA